MYCLSSKFVQSSHSPPTFPTWRTVVILLLYHKVFLSFRFLDVFLYHLLENPVKVDHVLIIFCVPCSKEQLLHPVCHIQNVSRGGDGLWEGTDIRTARWVEGIKCSSHHPSSRYSFIFHIIDYCFCQFSFSALVSFPCWLLSGLLWSPVSYLSWLSAEVRMFVSPYMPSGNRLIIAPVWPLVMAVDVHSMTSWFLYDVFHVGIHRACESIQKLGCTEISKMSLFRIYHHLILEFLKAWWIWLS